MISKYTVTPRDKSLAPKNNKLIVRKLRSYWLNAFQLSASVLVAFTLIASVFVTTTTHAVSSRIVGGSNFDISSAPATVALLSRSRVELDGNLFQAQGCGGIVIGARWVLTAAHCLFDGAGRLQANDVMVLMGSSDLANPTTQPISVTKIITHENFTSVDNGYDIALLRLESDALVTPAKLDAVPVSQDEFALVAGWGSVTAGTPQSFPSVLQGAFVKMTPGASCSAYEFTDERFICATPTTGYGGTCDHDSGGPLYRITGSGLPVKTLVGITSFKSVLDECKGSTEYPAGYTSVAAYAGWIENNAGITAAQASVQEPAEQPTQEPAQEPTQEPAQESGIGLEGTGWWQILRTTDYQEFYQGEAKFVPLPADFYTVINLTNGYRSENVRVTANEAAGSDEPAGSEKPKGINLAGEGWWQIQSSSDYTEFYQGPSKFVTLRAGIYTITNFTTGYRTKNIVVR